MGKLTELKADAADNLVEAGQSCLGGMSGAYI